jgi:hypothetical protein
VKSVNDKSDANTPKVAPRGDGILRDKIREHRDKYFVVYHPADTTLPFANVSLVFPHNGNDTKTVKRCMEDEAEHWVKRFPVPIMVSAFDAKEDLIHFAEDYRESFLVAYIDPPTGRVTRVWGVTDSNKLPADQSEPEYLKRVYKDVPYRLQEEIRQKVEREARSTGRAIRLILFFMFVVPVLVELIGLGVTWLGHLVSGISILAGGYKAAKGMGWLKASKRDEEEAERRRKMEHYFYHCERNPEAFEQLKFANFEKDAVERTRKEAEEIRRAPNP